jgi:putative peptide zinc metalloprotease protein
VRTGPSNTQDLLACRLRLNNDLVITPQEHGGILYYHIESPHQGKFFRVGYAEYVLISLLDGNTTLAQAVTASVRVLGAAALPQKKALEVASWLLQNSLAQPSDSIPTDPLNQNRTEQKANLLRRLNPFWMKWKVGNPDRLLASILPACGWLFSRWAVTCGVLIICAGLAVILTNWDGFVSSSHMIFAPHNWLSLGIAWIVLKLVHELAHALSCKRYGGEVRETGLIFILFAPAAYVDVTSCWRFPSKWQRIHVAAAGMYAELVIAGLAALIWQQSDATILRHGLFNIVLMASVSTLLFNANPLMRFDGYYLLADWLEIPNLSTEGSAAVQRKAKRLFWGVPDTERVQVGWRGNVIRTYGLAATCWRVVVSTSLIIASIWLWHGAGVLLGFLGVVAWFGVPLHKLLRECFRQYYEAPQVLIRSSVVTVALLSLLAAVLAWVPWPGTVTAPAIVEYTDLSIVRCGAAGFVKNVLVHDGQQVAAGELLAELRNDELAVELRDLELEAAQAELLHRSALNERDAGRVQIALRNQQAIAERLQELRDIHAHLRIHAPVAGRVVARNLKNLIDTYVSEGSELLAIGDERWKELRLSISHDEVANIQSLVGQPVRFRLNVGGLHQGTLTRIELRASRQLPHPAFSATVGGPLVVQENSEPTRSKAPQLVAPRFPAVVTITPAVGDMLACGDRGYALLGRYHESLGTHLWRRMTLWFERLGAESLRSP